MLNIENPTVEEAVACMLLAVPLQIMLDQIAKTPQAALGMILLQSSGEQIDGPKAFACIAKAAELFEDIDRIARQADALMAQAKKASVAS